jgi:hypothetical protein
MVNRWIEDGVAYWAISDVASTELWKFAELFRDTPRINEVRLARIWCGHTDHTRHASFC